MKPRRTLSLVVLPFMFMVMFMGCASAPVPPPEPVLVVYNEDRIVRWDEPLHFDRLPTDKYLVIYGRDLRAPAVDHPNTRKWVYRPDETRSAWLEPFADTGVYDVYVGVLRNDRVVLWSRPVSVFMEAPPPPTPAAVKRIEVEFQPPRLMFRPFGQYTLGFKIVWSKNPDPVYPTRAGDLAVYRSLYDPRDVWLEPFDGPGEYYVRVFEYLGDEKTGIVSQTLRVTLP